MAGTLIIQSAPPGPPAWLERCMASVAGWCAAHGHGYRRIGDALFDRIPADIAVRLGDTARIPRTDLARLLWLAAALDEGWTRAAWIDSDVLLFDPDAFALPAGTPFACTREYWLWDEGNGLEARDAVSNAVLCFTTRAGLLDWYLAAAHQILRTAPLPINRLALGPQLLSEVHRLRPLPLIETVATLSPLLLAEAIAGGGPGLAAHRAAWAPRIAGAHLCRSLGHTADAPALIPPHAFDPAIDRLLADGATLLNA